MLGSKPSALTAWPRPNIFMVFSVLTLAIARIIPYIHVRHPSGWPTAIQILFQTNLSNQEMLGSKPSALTAWPRSKTCLPITHLISSNYSIFFPVLRFLVPGVFVMANDSNLSPQILPSLEANSHKRILPVAAYQIQQKRKILFRSF